MKASNKKLEALTAKYRRMNMSEYEICLRFAETWPKLCPKDPAKHLFKGLTFRTKVVYRAQYVWAEEYRTVMAKTALDLFRAISDQYRLDKFNRVLFREEGHEML